MSSTATAAQIAEAWGVPKSTVIRRADAEGWAYSEEPGRGGMRRCYTVDQLPAALRAKLAWRGPAADATPETRAAAQAGQTEAARLALRGSLEARAAEARQQSTLRQAGELDAKAQARMDARLAVVRAFEMFTAQMPGLPVAQQRVLFVERYNAGQVEVASAVREHLGNTSDSSIERWQREIRTRGITALAGAYGNRAGSGKVDSHPELREFVQGMLAKHPHARASHVMKGLRARYAGRADLPSQRSLERWIGQWREENAEVLQALANPDAWRWKYITAFGSYSADVQRLNQLWELDSSPADLMCEDGRHCLIAGIDVKTRRVRMLVSKTSRSVAVAGLLRAMLLDFGVPEEAKTDNGSDYVSKHIVRVFSALDVKHSLCDPFDPNQKPHIERFFGTFARDLVEMLPGYIGHSVADRKAIEARRSFAERLTKRGEVVEVRLSGADLQAFCDKWVNDLYLHAPHEGLDRRTPFEVAAACTDTVRHIDDERALDVLLAEAPENDGWRTVQKKGIRVDDAWFIAPELHAWVGSRVQVRLDALDHDLGRLFVFGDIAGQGAQQFVCVAECPERTGMDRREVATRARALQKERMQAARKAMRSVAKRARTDDLVEDILRDRAEAAGKLTLLPSRPTVAHTSAGLIAAAESARAASQPQRTTADIEHLAEVQAMRTRLAAQAIPAGTTNELAERRGPVPAPVFETVAERVQWLLRQAGHRALSTEEQDTLAQFRRAQPASYRRMQELVAEQLGSAKENAPGAVAGPSGAV